MTKATAPTREIGYAVENASYGWWLYDGETTPELIWPQSVSVYNAMRRTDAQVASVLRAVTLPVRRTPWRLRKASTSPALGSRSSRVKFFIACLLWPRRRAAGH